MNKKDKVKSARISIVTDQETREALERGAKKENRSLSNYVEKLLKKAVSEAT